MKTSVHDSGLFHSFGREKAKRSKLIWFYALEEEPTAPSHSIDGNELLLGIESLLPQSWSLRWRSEKGHRSDYFQYRSLRHLYR